MSTTTYIIDGNRFSTLEEFFEEVSQVLIPGVAWGRNMNAFHDILSGGFGTPEDGFTLIWKNSQRSREELGRAATIAFYEEIWQRYREHIEEELAQWHYNQLKAIHPESEFEVSIQREVAQQRTYFREGYRDTENRLAQARRGEGDTVFDWIVSTIQAHPNIELHLE